jgi:hypothetical protein
MKLIHKIKFSLQICFLVCGCLTLRFIFNLGVYSSTLKKLPFNVVNK